MSEVPLYAVSTETVHNCRKTLVREYLGSEGTHLAARS